MLKIISSKNESDIFSFSRTQREKAKINSAFSDCLIDEAVAHAENISIFGTNDAYMVRIEKENELEMLDEKIIKSLQNSNHFFVLVGSGVEFERKCAEAGKEEGLKVFKVTAKFVNDFPAELVTSLQKLDKKNSWNLLLKELRNKDAEPIHGSCIFAYKTLLAYLNDPKKNDRDSGIKDFPWNNAKRNAIAGKREKQEVSEKYFDLIVAYFEARDSVGDLATNLERWMLK